MKWKQVRGKELKNIFFLLCFDVMPMRYALTDKEHALDQEYGWEYAFLTSSQDPSKEHVQ